MRPNVHETTDKVTFTEEILNGKLNFLCSILKINPVKPLKHKKQSPGGVF